ADVPSLQNGLVAKEGLSVTWRLQKNATWHDGKPFTADDVVFNWEYSADSATAATASGQYRDIARIDKLDSHTIKIVFKTPTPSRRRVPCSRRASTTTPGTCKWRTTSSSAWSRAARAASTPPSVATSSTSSSTRPTPGRR